MNPSGGNGNRTLPAAPGRRPRVVSDTTTALGFGNPDAAAQDTVQVKIRIEHQDICARSG